MKKKLLSLAFVILLLLSLVGYGTLAYTTVEGTATNVITSGGVKIALVETTDSGRPFPADGVHGVVPGTTQSKIVNVRNTGAHTAWVRVSVDVAILLANEGEPDTDLIRLDYNRTHWREKDGYFYYLHPLKPGESTEVPLFTKVTFDAGMGNMYQGSEARVTVCAMATQWANNGSTVWEAKGWPTENEK